MASTDEYQKRHGVCEVCGRDRHTGLYMFRGEYMCSACLNLDYKPSYTKSVESNFAMMHEGMIVEPIIRRHISAIPKCTNGKLTRRRG